MAIMQHRPNRIEDAITAMDRTVFKIANKFKRNHQQDLQDLIQAGRLGICQAYDRYDPNAGSAFSSYAYQYAWVHIKEYATRNWNTYNHTSGTPIEERNDLETAPMTDDVLDFKVKLSKMTNTERAIVKARAEGFTFQQISEAMEKLGRTMTLHQVRNQYLAAIG
jgi:RNA polymerase sigma factor (sigma-70 family)